MSKKSKLWGFSVLIGTLIVILTFVFNIGATRDKAWHLIKPDLIAQNSELKTENQRLKHSVSSLEKQNKRMKTVLLLLRKREAIAARYNPYRPLTYPAAWQTSTLKSVECIVKCWPKKTAGIVISRKNTMGF